MTSIPRPLVVAATVVVLALLSCQTARSSAATSASAATRESRRSSPSLLPASFRRQRRETPDGRRLAVAAADDDGGDRRTPGRFGRSFDGHGWDSDTMGWIKRRSPWADNPDIAWLKRGAAVDGGGGGGHRGDQYGLGNDDAKRMWDDQVMGWIKRSRDGDVQPQQPMSMAGKLSDAEKTAKRNSWSDSDVQWL